MSLSPSARVVIIGGTSGIGLAVAHQVAATGARVIIGSRSPQSVEQALTGLPENASGAAVDVTDPASLQEFLDAAGPFDHLAYTAGDELVRGPISSYDPERAAAFFDVRFFRALDAVRLARPHLHERGSITLTAGAAALHGGPGRALGGAVGGAVIAAARSLAVELAPVRVNVIAPGLVRTPLFRDLPASFFEQAGEATLLGRVAEPEDVAQAFVAAMEQDYLTGNVTVVDGGSVLK
ncbi:SDR family oxidoreductase [Kineosporia mesophila]|uniref:SDR family oxidoreductase n=1 Tax=Kineosporia mesophila TaxID=566012 RepID=A0ABP7AKZ7_9ACTN|nr:SDR family oxidoreductase [Kineosporia mesophila]MCD5355018.1 SDR family oxidoreductase [Kineosporia mesophila]